MFGIFRKEINTFFSSFIGYMVIAVFLMVLGLMMFVFPDTSLLHYRYASLDQLFDLAPAIFLFLIPAITMRSFAEERQAGTIELLATRPLKEMDIILGKFLACLGLMVFALLPTGLYYYTVYTLGAPPGTWMRAALPALTWACCFWAVLLWPSACLPLRSPGTRSWLLSWLLFCVSSFTGVFSISVSCPSLSGGETILYRCWVSITITPRSAGGWSIAATSFISCR